MDLWRTRPGRSRAERRAALPQLGLQCSSRARSVLQRLGKATVERKCIGYTSLEEGSSADGSSESLLGAASVAQRVGACACRLRACMDMRCCLGRILRAASAEGQRHYGLSVNWACFLERRLCGARCVAALQGAQSPS